MDLGLSALSGKVQTARYFIRTELPIAPGFREAIADACPMAIEIPETSFS